MVLAVRLILGLPAMVAVTTAQASTLRLSMILVTMVALIMSTLALTWTRLPVTKIGRAHV